MYFYYCISFCDSPSYNSMYTRFGFICGIDLFKWTPNTWSLITATHVCTLLWISPVQLLFFLSHFYCYGTWFRDAVFFCIFSKIRICEEQWTCFHLLDAHLQWMTSRIVNKSLTLKCNRARNALMWAFFVCGLFHYFAVSVVFLLKVLSTNFITVLTRFTLR